MSFARREMNINQMTKRKLRIVAENYRLRLNAAAERAAMAAPRADRAAAAAAAAVVSGDDGAGCRRTQRRLDRP